MVGRYFGLENNFTETLPDCSKATHRAVICGGVILNSVIYSDGRCRYNRLVDVGLVNIFALIMDAISSRHTLMALKGSGDSPKLACLGFADMSKSTFYFHPKECGFKSNYRYQCLL